MKTTIIYIFLTILTSALFAQVPKAIVLNQPDLKRGLPVMEALFLRASASEFTDTKLSLQDLSDLLWAANGINRKETGKERPLRQLTPRTLISMYLQKKAFTKYHGLIWMMRSYFSMLNR